MTPLLSILTPQILKALGITVKYLCIPTGPHTLYIIAGILIISVISIASFLVFQELKRILLKEPKKDDPSPFQDLLDSLLKDIEGNKTELAY